MKLTLFCIGKLPDWIRQGADDYAGRIGHYVPFDTVELKEEKTGGKKADPAWIAERECDQLLARVPDDAYLVALDEKGKGRTSEELAALLDRHMLEGTRNLALVIGGPYGLSNKLKTRADMLLSLSPLTLTHQIARLLLLEQIYRGFTILRNEPYHNR